MNIKKHALINIVLLLQMLMFMFVILVFKLDAKLSGFDSFIYLCKMGFFVSLVNLICLLIVARDLFHPIVVIFFSFVVFQFGLPFIYALKKNYSNFYINLFDSTVLINAAVYSILCIQVFALAITFEYLLSINRNNGLFGKTNWSKNEDFIKKISFALFLVLYTIVLPLVVYAALLSIRDGFNSQTRSFLADNAFFRLVQAFYIPSLILFLCYSDSNKKTHIVSFLALIVSALQLIAGDRSRGLLAILAVVYCNFDAKDGERTSIFRQFQLLIIGIVLVAVIEYVAQSRMMSINGNVSGGINNNWGMDFISELGFNFTTICFVMSYVPSVVPFKGGVTYFTAFLSLIPKSLDPTGTLGQIATNTPENWLKILNQGRYGTTLNFGVGFSSIGESYLNFSTFGLFVILICGLVVGYFLTLGSRQGKWEKYLQIFTFVSILSFPRRGFYDLLKNLEYGVFGMAILLFIVFLVVNKIGKSGGRIES